MPAPVEPEEVVVEEIKPRKKQYGLHFLTGLTTIGILTVLFMSGCKKMRARSLEKAKIRAKE